MVIGIKENLDLIREKINQAEYRSNRAPGSVKLLGVTKQVDTEKIVKAIESDHKSFGENYVQEFTAKYDILSKEYGDSLDWHFIGHLQKNKVKYIIDKVNLIHSLDKLSLAEELNKRAEGIDKKISVLVEVNLGEESSKSGISSNELEGFVENVSGFKNIKLSGLMTIPPYSENPEDSRPYYVKLRNMMEELNTTYKSLLELSMGMSNDYEVAIEEGTTIIRIGTAIFGERQKKKIYS